MARRDPRTESIRVAIYRRMTRERKIRIAMQMHDDAVQIVRDSVRQQYPDWDASQMEIEVRRRVMPRGTPEAAIRGRYGCASSVGVQHDAGRSIA